MKKIPAVILFAFLGVGLTACSGVSAERSNKELAERIISDTLMDRVESMALELVRGGFTAGDSYGEVWIRDYNTFIELAMEVMPDEAVQENLLTFFRFQGDEGDIVDGFIPIEAARAGIGYNYRFSPSEPRYAAHKNTVETDQESSLVQAVRKYVAKSGNTAFLNRLIDAKTVLQRLEWSLDYLLNHRYDEQYGLLWGATTADWGDVQPEHEWGGWSWMRVRTCAWMSTTTLFLS